MLAIGIRELKSQLSQYIKIVQSGETLLITDRNKIVAELRQATHEIEFSNDSKLEKYILKSAKEGTIKKAIRRESFVDTFYKKNKSKVKVDWKKAYAEIKEDR
ncbi:MAG TPA: type II toxin-antitoxin system prevent-host-death family antitoxin [Leptospiraceae bacterium]|nr:type II toxin-antitoxin system prevent-host-death family antitoxin [Leptospiraceae bacterium]HRG76925.1 type II toxin-antitoxin system prevent-host-death family antitoxin [Leptospiraceae bacterium]